ncbi:MAG: polyphosphate kinase 2 family protein [Mariprofundus sp.]
MRDSESFRTTGKHRIRLADVNPDQTISDIDKADLEGILRQQRSRLQALQYSLFAESKRSLLICLQAPDAGGKDGTIRHVFGCLNPQGCYVQPFKVPTPEEAAHDFLWRAHRAAPGKGKVAIFNRSHYEDVLSVRVHNLVARDEWRKRYDAINDFERHLSANGTVILKFFLHISKEEQLKRFGKRLQDTSRQWKISEADYRERSYWDDYQHAYQAMIDRCSTAHAPWYVIPANHKWSRNLLISTIVLEQLEALDIRLPEPGVDIKEIRRKYHIEKNAA